jgi:hypothetical protein
VAPPFFAVGPRQFPLSFACPSFGKTLTDISPCSVAVSAPSEPFALVISKTQEKKSATPPLLFFIFFLLRALIRTFRAIRLPRTPRLATPHIGSQLRRRNPPSRILSSLAAHGRLTSVPALYQFDCAAPLSLHMLWLVSRRPHAQTRYSTNVLHFEQRV